MLLFLVTLKNFGVCTITMGELHALFSEGVYKPLNMVHSLNREVSFIWRFCLGRFRSSANNTSYVHTYRSTPTEGCPPVVADRTMET